MNKINRMRFDFACDRAKIKKCLLTEEETKVLFLKCLEDLKNGNLKRILRRE